MIIPKETDGDNKIIKYKRMIRKCALNIIVWLENNTNPTEEDMIMLKGLQAKLKDSIYYYEENIKNWEKHTTTLELPQPVLEHQEYLKTGIDAQQEE